MKKTRLLEIIREEISGALGEMPDVHKDSNLLKEIEQLAEMVSMKQLKDQLEKQNMDSELKAVKAAEKATIDKLKKDPVFSGEGNNQRLKGYVKNLKKELKDTHDISLQNLLSDVAAGAEEAGDKFNDDIATNTIEKNAANTVLGKEPGKRGRKADPNKPKKEKTTGSGKRGRPAGAAKTATRTKDDDGFDKVEYSDTSDEGPSSADISSDETAKSLSSTPEEKKEKFNMGLRFIKKYKDDKPKIDAYMKKAKEEYKLTKSMLDDLNRAAGRGVE